MLDCTRPPHGKSGLFAISVSQNPSIVILFHLQPDMNEYGVVGQTMLQCREEMPMDIQQLELQPHPLILPNKDFSLTYSMELAVDMPIDVWVSRARIKYFKRSHT